jgi:tellurite resistance protein TehA-like permease
LTAVQPAPPLKEEAMRDLKNPNLMLLKAVLFVGIGLIAAAMLVADTLALRTVVLLLLVIWSFSRAYFFAFYVIEKYIDPSYRFSGLFSAAKFIVSRRR